MRGASPSSIVLAIVAPTGSESQVMVDGIRVAKKAVDHRIVQHFGYEQSSANS